MDDREIDIDLQSMKTSIELNFERLESIFHRWSEGEERLKPMPGLMIPTLNVPYELTTVHALRALELSRGAARLIEDGNQVSAFPVLRSLFETWIALAYAEERFRALAVDQSKWTRFDEIAMRILLGRTQPGGREVITIGHMFDQVKRSLAETAEEEGAEEGWVDFLDDWYSILSDGTHPTTWSLAFYGEPRSDGLGVTWNRTVDARGMASLLGELEMSLSVIVKTVESLLDVAGELRDTFRTGPYQDAQLRSKAVEVLRRIGISERPSDMTDEAFQIARTRARSLSEFLEATPEDSPTTSD